MKKTIILIPFLLLFAFLKTNAQISFAPKVGINLAKLTGEYNSSNRLRMQIGCILNTNINEMISFQPGLVISGKGATYDQPKEAITLTYLEVPFNGVLNLKLGSGKIQIYAGPYFSLCLAGKDIDEEDNETESLDIGNSEGDEIKTSDLGINIGIGYKFEKFQIQGGYGGSFTDISPVKDWELKNNVISLTFAYFINL